MKIIAQRWDKLDDASKQSYIAAYKNDLVSYSSILEKYNKSLTPKQKEAQQQLKLDKQLQKEKREKKKRLRELEKPKKPGSPFFMYLSKNVPSGSSVTEYQAAAKQASAVWKSMSEAEKAPYVNKYKELHESHLKSLAKWEEKMLRQGNDDLVPESRRSPRSKGK
jgi:GH15 family glucan-1,4-alpha-glucosidase